MRQRLVRLCASLARFVCREALRAVITSAFITAGVWGAMSYMGVPLPDVEALLETVESVSALSRILS